MELFSFVPFQDVGAFTSNPVMKFADLKKVEESAPTLIVFESLFKL